MRQTISQKLSENKRKRREEELQSTSSTVSDTKFVKDERIDQKELDKVYRSVPTLHSAINKRTQLILSRDRDFEGPNADFFRAFFESIGNNGGDTHWEEIIENIFKHQFIYGESFIELIKDDSGKIVDLTFLDPTRVDYAKNSKNNILLDDDGNPLGYTQKIPTGHVGRFEQPFDVPDEVNNLHNRIFLPADVIVHFKYNTIRDGFYPLGLVEPVYRPAERSFQLQEDYANKAHTSLFPTRVLRVGDERHEPSPQKIQTAVDRLKGSDVNTEMAIPYYMELDMFEAENPEAMIEFFEQFSDEVISGTGMPKAFVRGGGEINRATLEAQRKMLEVSIEQDIKRTIQSVERGILEPIAESHNLSDYPDYVFEDFSEDDITEENTQNPYPYTLQV